MKKFLLLVAVLGGLFYFRPDLLPSFGKKGAFDAQGNPAVLVFTDNNCPACAKALQDLRERNVAFEEIPLASGKEAVSRYERQGGHGLIPLVVVGREVIDGYDPARMASALGAAFGDKALTQLERVFYTNHFDENGAPHILMYGTSWCQYCKAARADLEQRHIPYYEVDVEASPNQQALVNALDITGYPLFYVGYTRLNPGAKAGLAIAALDAAVKRH